MVQFKGISKEEFLSDYWQKKPLVIRQAIPAFDNPLSPDELAGLALEEEIESRIVWETPGKEPYWHLKRGPFLEKDFQTMAKTHWTLLVQGVDRFVPEVNNLLQYFTFIPSWRIDDVMISYATKHGSVGPHYDNYDVFLYQAKGSRKWLLTTQGCNQANALENVDLRIMKHFVVEEEYLLEEGDMLYLPAHVGHYGIADSADCMTYSFGYRSYQAREILDSFAEYVAEKRELIALYKDPNWNSAQETSAIPEQAWQNAKALLQELLDDDALLRSWFGCFVTQLDQQAEMLLPLAEENTKQDYHSFMRELAASNSLRHNAVCRFAYEESASIMQLFINGCEWEVNNISTELVKLVANKQSLSKKEIFHFLNKEANQIFLFDLWQLEWLEFY